MTIGMTRAVNTHRSTLDVQIEDHLETLVHKVRRLTEDYKLSGKIYSSEVRDVVNQGLRLLADTAVHVELTHLQEFKEESL